MTPAEAHACTRCAHAAGGEAQERAASGERRAHPTARRAALVALVLVASACAFAAGARARRAAQSYVNEKAAQQQSWECYTHGDRSDYAGAINTTRSRKPCAPWPIQFDSFGYAGHNYCRRPAPVNLQCAWCFTDVATHAWECCRLPPPQPMCNRPPTEPPRLFPRAPRLPVTVRPASPSPSVPSPPPPSFDGLGSGSGGSGPDGGFPRARPTEPVHTPSEECYHAFDGSDYRGKVNTTARGYTCQRWDRQQPHGHQYDPMRYPDAGLEANYCRRPDGDGPHCAWCYTLEPQRHDWDCCDIGARAHA